MQAKWADPVATDGVFVVAIYYMNVKKVKRTI